MRSLAKDLIRQNKPLGGWKTPKHQQMFPKRVRNTTKKNSLHKIASSEVKDFVILK